MFGWDCIVVKGKWLCRTIMCSRQSRGCGLVKTNVIHSSHSRFIGVVIQGGVSNNLVRVPTWVIRVRDD